jgi:acyl-CoA thioester hydrolase
VIFAECHINYRSPVYFDEEVAIECSIGEVRRSAFQVLFTMRAGERVAAEGYGWLVGFDYGTEKAVPLPGQFKKVLQDAA